MNVYQKLAEARVRFQGGNPKMSGENTFAKYKYFELADILPIINNLGKEIGFVCEVSFTETLATLLFRDAEKPEDVITFTSPMSTAQLKGCHEVQNLGAVETYVKRYLYQNAFEIVESDALNSTQGADNGKPGEKAPAKPAVNPELKSATVALEAYIASGTLSGDEAKKAQSNIDTGNLVNINKWIEYAKQKENAK